MTKLNKTLLITQCLQNDFVKPLAKNEPLPNLLHIGHEESKRLFGQTTDDSPITNFMAWSQANTNLDKIHIRDWHDPESSDQIKHLNQFGFHCIKNTSGADFIFKINNTESSTIINSTTLNDFEETPLTQILNQYNDIPLRVGLIGVWTEAKIFFLAYELSTRYQHFDIAVCSALTASSSRSQHFQALEQLKRITGVTVLNSIGEFKQFLGESDNQPIKLPYNESLIINSDTDFSKNKEDLELIRYLFRDCQEINLKILDGGFSGNLVAGVISIDHLGHQQAAHVIKIGPRSEMAKERTAFEQIEAVLGNNAPAIAEHADLQTKGAIKYRYASVGSGKATSFQEFYQNNDSSNSINKIKDYLNDVFKEQLARLYRASNDDNHNLLEYYCFDSSWAESVKNKIISLIGECPDQDDLKLPTGKSTSNLYSFYKHDLDNIKPIIADFPFSFIHGDLNGANIIIDEKENIWLIDFFHTHRGHVLKDFVKLENDLLYIYTPINSEQDLKLAYDFTDFILSQKNPLDLPVSLPAQFKGTAFTKAYEILKHIRELAKGYIRQDHAYKELQWLIPQLRYAVHTIGFDEPTKLQRVWALYTACEISKSRIIFQ
ncbi:MAG: phosphotransferase [Gammaproteobacteria bacterium]